MIKNCTTIKLF